MKPSIARLVLPIVFFVLCIAISLTTASLPFIPEWLRFQEMTVYASLLTALALGVLMVRGIWLQTKERLKTGFRWVLTIAIGFLSLGMLFMTAFLSEISIHGLFESTSADHQIDFPAYATTVYVYDSSWLDPAMTLKMRRGKLPFTEEMGTNYHYSASQFEMHVDGEWAESDVVRLHLPTGKWEKVIP
jgi:hypothetical protein